MKTRIKNKFLLPALIAGLGLILAGRVTAQTFTVLHSFTATSGPLSANSDGANPGQLILSGNTLYGAARWGGSSGEGTVFKVNTNGTGFTRLYSFTAMSGSYPGPYTNSDGANPIAGLISSNNTLYGTAFDGGSGGEGTMFAVNTDGRGFTNLHSFTETSHPGYSDGTNSDGFNPYAGLVISGSTLYGAASGGGSGAEGTVFKVNTDGIGFTNLYSFTALNSSTNSDGAYPNAGLILTNNTLYGTAYNGGSSGGGTVFKVNTDGTGFTNLYSFTATSGSYPNYTNSDGANPIGLILSGNTLYGAASGGGTGGEGTVFKVNTDGTGFTNLYSFTAPSGCFPCMNSDGGNPAGLILSGNTLYGTANQGGSSGNGTVFKVNTDGTGFTNVYSFTAGSGSWPNITNSDGANPIGLILSGNTLYGTAFQGGRSGNGTVFSLSLGLVSPPQLTIIPSGANVVLTWPTNAAGFTLQSTTNLGSTAVWITNSPAPVVADGQNAVTNPISGTRKFYRLSQ